MYMYIATATATATAATAIYYMGCARLSLQCNYPIITPVQLLIAVHVTARFTSHFAQSTFSLLLVWARPITPSRNTEQYLHTFYSILFY